MSFLVEFAKVCQDMFCSGQRSVGKIESIHVGSRWVSGLITGCTIPKIKPTLPKF